ncbi:MAG: outer membrane lipoprotein carrier protein LolA [Acidobacteriia bacterium]|nr:outer membrane lipoprotein carrier protein LolA [Terriglobia bacterium]
MDRARRCPFPAILAIVGIVLSLGGGFALPHKGKLAPDLSEVLSHMNESAKRLKTVSASLEYTKVTVLVNDVSTETGQLFYRRGTEILINIKKPEPKTILFRKNRGEIFSPRINQIQEYDLEGKNELVEQFFLLGFNTDADKLKKEYEMKLLKEENLNGDTTVVLELVPRSEAMRAQISEITLWVSEESWLPVQQKFLQPGGDYFTARYTNVKVNRQLPSSAFRVPAPPDAKRVKVN